MEQVKSTSECSGSQPSTTPNHTAVGVADAHSTPNANAAAMSAVSGVETGFEATTPGCAGDPESLRNLIVNYLPPLMNEMQLCDLFSQFGPVESVKIIYDKETKESRGYGFVKYVYFFSATYALNSLNGYHIAGKRLKVAYANADAAMEDYKTLRTSAMMFSMQQQMALQSLFCQQMVLAQEQQQQQQQQLRRHPM